MDPRARIRTLVSLRRLSTARASAPNLRIRRACRFLPLSLAAAVPRLLRWFTSPVIGRTVYLSVPSWLPRRPRPLPALLALSAVTRWPCSRSAVTTWGITGSTGLTWARRSQRSRISLTSTGSVLTTRATSCGRALAITSAFFSGSSPVARVRSTLWIPRLAMFRS